MRGTIVFIVSMVALASGVSLSSGTRAASSETGTVSSGGGASSPGARDVSPVDSRVRTRWLKERSYYAFLEIVDSQLDPAWRPGATSADVQAALGLPTCAGPDCYPNFTKRDWFYETNRQILGANKALLSFDESGMLKSLEWVSE